MTDFNTAPPDLLQKWAMIRRLRAQLPPNHPSQPRLAELDRELFAREQTADNPLRAPGLMAMTVADAMGKKMGLVKGRSKPSLDQVMAGWRGALSGVGDYAKGILGGSN